MSVYSLAERLLDIAYDGLAKFPDAIWFQMWPAHGLWLPRYHLVACVEIDLVVKA